MNLVPLQGWVAAVGWVAVGTVVLSLLVSMYRVLRGPTPVDQVAALDMIGLSTVSGITLTSMLRGAEFWIDIAIVPAVMTFLGTIALAQYMLRR